MNKDVELRTLNVECSANEESRTISGYAICSNTLSCDLGGFYEVIEPSALDGIVERCDVKAYYNHLPEKGVLARSRMGKGSLHLEVRDGNLYFEFEAPNTELGNYVLEGIRRKDFDQCSFGFLCDEDRWEKREDGSYLRHINSFKYISEISIVPDPAYSATSASCRSFEAFKEEERKALEEIKANEKAELDNYYNELESKLQ